MTTHTRLVDLFSIAPRFQRSIQIQQALKEQQGLEGYLLTPTAYHIVQKIIQACQDPRATRSFTLTGPYGVGKSALGLFLAKLLSTPSSPEAIAARQLLDRQAILHELESAVVIEPDGQGLLPIAITG